ncbi:MAG: ribosomal protein S18-alanine N-acetyltransferase [Sphingomonadaceae bacterium]|nr:ribosomal protein S18-alanine N-acetyltransferase [Sphingomonadaceae bacterium]
MIELVEGDASDIAAIMPVMEDAFDPAFGEAWTSAQCLSALAMPGCRLLLAKQDNQICGFSMSRWVLDTEELLMIGVARRRQRQNIGGQLLAKTIDHARREGRSQLFLEVREGNSAQEFYRQVGFLPIGRRKNYYKGPDGFRPDAITMSFAL